MGTVVVTQPARGIIQATWTLCTGGAEDYVDMSRWSDKTMHIYGTPIGTLKLQGSNTAANWVSLTYDGTNAIEESATGPALRLMYENARYVRPLVTGTTSGTTSYNIVVVGVKAS